LDLFFFTAENAESAEEEGKRGDGSLLDAFQFNSVSIGFVFFYRRERRERRGRGEERDRSLLDAFQFNSVILREAKNLKSLQQCLECVSPIGFLFVSLKAKHLQLEFFDKSKFFSANALPLCYFCLRSIEDNLKSAYPSSLILFK
jgi:hypothetical protein